LLSKAVKDSVIDEDKFSHIKAIKKQRKDAAEIYEQLGFELGEES